ncbi:MAG: hypothetical protein GC162_13510 [Planctomycetes bacterium]|nr:hypothetical protein [Planctomycetota bacterium]
MYHVAKTCVATILVGLSFGAVPGAGAGATPDPMNLGAGASNAFGVDLYRQLVERHRADNVFFSPWSITEALAMAMQGARGATAEEMGRVLNLPDALRSREPGDRPWDTAHLNSGLGAADALMKPPAVDPAARQKLAALRKQLADAQAQVARLQERQQWKEANEAQQHSRQLAEAINALAPTIDPYELNVANALWGERTYPFDPSYVDAIDKAFGTAGVFNVDFRHDFPAARKRINEWAALKTHDRIKDIIPELDPDEAKLLRLILTNAIYFKGEWSTPFDAKNTNDAPFALADGNKAMAKMMHAEEMGGGRYGAFDATGALFDTPRRIARGQTKGLYPEPGGFAMVDLPYKGGALSMIVIAPDRADGLPAIEKMMTSGKLATWIGQLQKRQVNVNLPRFKLETEYALGEPLMAMGMKRAFTDPRDAAGGADFSGMTTSTDPQDRLYITGVLHKAFVEVNEKGTEAAAVTAVMMAGTLSAPIDEPFTPTFSADRPFMYLIRHNATGAIVFMGRMTHPTN